MPQPPSSVSLKIEELQSARKQPKVLITDGAPNFHEKPDTAILRGFADYHNFARLHEALQGKT